MNTSVFPADLGGQEKIKSYWNRPGGKFGTIFGVGLLAAAGYYLVPILTTIVWNVVNFGIACAVGFLLYMVLSNRKLWLSIFYLYEILIKKLVGVVIELDPFVIADDYIKDIVKQRETLKDKIDEINTQKEVIESKIAEKTREKIKCLDRAKAAKEKGMMMEMANEARQADRLNTFIIQLTPIQENLDKLGKHLHNVHVNSGYMLQDMKNDLEIKKDMYKSVTKGQGALKSALSIFNGDPEKKLMLEQSMDFLKEDMGSKVAYMKRAISESSEFMKSIDLDNATYQAAGLRMLEEYDPTIFKSESKEQMIASPAYQATLPSSSKYEKIFQISSTKTTSGNNESNSTGTSI